MSAYSLAQILKQVTKPRRRNGILAPLGALRARIAAVWAAAVIFSAGAALADWWTATIPPAFPPSIPSSANGAVDYWYEFSAYSWGDIACCIDTTDEVRGKTQQIGSVGGNLVVNNGVAEAAGMGMYPTCCDIEGSGSSHCRQSFDGMTTPATYSPNVSTFSCQYQDGYFYNHLVFYPDPNCWVMTTDVSSGDGWTMQYTHPAYFPPRLCYYNKIKTCPHNGQPWPAPQCHLQVFGWSGYYSVTVHVDQGKTPPTLPSLPGPAGMVSGEGCSSGGCGIPGMVT